MRKPKIYNLFKKELCQINNDCLGPLDIDHVKTLGSGGKDEEFNLMTLCRKHHSEKGQKGLIYMSAKYPRVNLFLLQNGWRLCPTRIKWVRHE